MGRFRDSIHDIILGERLSDNMYLDNNGQLICENVVLARTGSYDYLESELMDDGDPNKIVQVFRTPEEVFNPISIKSMNYKPFVDEHPDKNVTPETVGDLQKGFMTNVRRGTGEFSECLMADLVVTDPEVIELIRSGRKRELSVGYTADIEEIDGKYYMKNIRGNHIALCEAGRAGNARIRDSKPLMDSKFANYEKLKVYIESKGYDVGDNYLHNGKKHIECFKGNRKYLLDVKEYVDGSFELLSDFRLPTYNDSKCVMDFEARGSFNSLDELISFYKGATTEREGNNLTVHTKSGETLLYSFVDDTSGKLTFIRKIHDSVKTVEVLGDSVKLREGQRLTYLGVEHKITEISPRGGRFLIEFGTGNGYVARVEYDDFIKYIDEGKIKLLDSVVFDSKSGKFGFVANDVDYSDCFTDKAVADAKEAYAVYFGGGSPQVCFANSEAAARRWAESAEGEKATRVVLLKKGTRDYGYYVGNDPRDVPVADAKFDDPAHEKELDRTHFIDGGLSAEYLNGLAQRAELAGNDATLEAIIFKMAYDDKVLYEKLRATMVRYSNGIRERRSHVADLLRAAAKERHDSTPYKKGDKVKPREGGSVEEIVDIITESIGSAGSGKTTKKYVMKSGHKYTAEDLEGSAWVRVTDSDVLNQGEAKWHKVADAVVLSKLADLINKALDKAEGNTISNWGAYASVDSDGDSISVSCASGNDTPRVKKICEALIAVNKDAKVDYKVGIYGHDVVIERKFKDDGEGVRRFRVVADGRTFETNATSAANAAQKVARALRDTYLSGRYVYFDYKDVKGKSLKSEIEKAYRDKFHQDIKVTRLSKHYTPGKRELEIQVIASGMHENFDGFWAVVGCSEEEAKTLRD